jgi:hypothetical protein
MKKQPTHEVENIGAQLLQPGAHSKHSAITNVDPLGVIERFTFADVAREGALWASLVRRHELQPGERVVVLAGPAWEWRCALLGVLYAGGVAVPTPDSASVAELRAIAADARARLVVSIPARPDLVEQEGPRALTGEQLETIDEREARSQPPHPTLPNDGALILYARTAKRLRGAVHTHASLAAQADSGEHWLGVGEDARVWCTATDGLAASIWLLLAAGRAHADIVNLNLELDPEEQLELLHRLRPSALWLSDEEYAGLASAAVPGWFDLGSIRRALVSDDSSAGATAFEEAFGARVTPVLGLNEVGVVAGWPAGMEDDAVEATAMPVPGIPLAVVDEQGKQLPIDQVGSVVVRGDAASLCIGYTTGETRRQDSWFHLQCRGALGADNSLRIATRPPLDTELVEAEVDVPPAELVQETAPERGADELELSTRLSKREAKQARRHEEREAKEQRKIEERRRREEERSRKLAERAEEKKRKEAKRAEDEKRRERERLAKESQRAEEKERAQREAAEADERRRAEEAVREEKRRREKEEKQRERDRLAKERATVEAEERAKREAAKAEERRRTEEAARAAERRREEEEKQSEQERLAKEHAKAEAEEQTRREAAEAEERQRAEQAARVKEQRREEEEQQREQERLAKEREQAEAEERARREAEKAEERRRKEEAQAAGAEERRREEEEKRRLAEERSRAEAEEQASREAAEAEERRRAEEAAWAEERRREEEEKQREQERLAKEREQAEARKRAQREAAEAEERRRAEEAARAEERRREEEEKQRERERRNAEKEARRLEERQAKQAARGQRKAARLGRRRRSKESEPDENGERRQRDSETEAAPEHLAADILSRISQYGMNVSPTAPEAEAPSDPRSPTEPTDRENGQ